MTTVSPLHTYMEIIHVPYIEGEKCYMLPYTAYSDGSISLPNDLTAEQREAFTTYVTYNNNHMRIQNGNSLSMMSIEQQMLYDALIESLKSNEQKHIERIQNFVLSQHRIHLQGYHQFVSWLDELSEEEKQDSLDDGDISSLDIPLYVVHITEAYRRYNHIIGPHLTTIYVVSEIENNLTIVQGCCNLRDNREYQEMCREEE